MLSKQQGTCIVRNGVENLDKRFGTEMHKARDTHDRSVERKKKIMYKNENEK